MSRAVLASLLALAAGPGKADPGAERRADRLVAVALFQKAPSVSFTPTGSFRAVDQATGELTALKAGKAYKVEAEKGKDGKPRLVFGPHLLKGPARLLPGKADEFITIGERRYRGNLLFRPNVDGTVTVIDELGLEEYLFGVLPHEMSPDWPLEALKAQAVVARTYALARLGRGPDAAFDLTDDNYSQVYTGLTTESELVRKAVRDTAGRILLYNGKPLPAFYHSTCGGHTAGALDVWG
ncbi:SpoIID/LytB domain-containing protein, partial [bacterium]